MSETGERSFPALVRHLVNDALSDDEIRSLCFDHFRAVYDQISPSMSRTECIRRLVEWCDRNRQFDRLIGYVRELNPAASVGYSESLGAVPDEDRYSALPIRTVAAALAPCVIHPLPPAPQFVGRLRERQALTDFWNDRSPGTVSMQGLGGAGKTALAAQFIDELTTAGQQGPAALFVWSFYVNQDVNAFLDAAYHYFSVRQGGGGGGVGAFYLLIESLNRPLRSLLVLDGLERVQRPRSDKSGLFGELTDPLLSQIVVRLAAGLGSTKCLITTRFPLPGLDPWRDKTFTVIDVDRLDTSDSRALLRRHGVIGDDVVLDRLVEEFGAHALTLDHVGGYIKAYAGGDPAKAAELPEPEFDAGEPQERRLARILNAYDTVLAPEERALLARLCIFRFGTTLERLHAIFSGGDRGEATDVLHSRGIKDFTRILKHLAQLHLALEGPENHFTAHPAIRDHFYRAFTNARVAHFAVRRHFSSLVDAPGTALPTTTDTIDLLEELVYHTLQTGQIHEAREIYAQRLGGYQHLAWNLGHYSRCIRILNEFPQCPDQAGLIWCYRAVGDLNAAERIVDSDDDWWLSMIGCLRGSLRDVADRLSERRQDPIRAVTEFMTGLGGLDAVGQAPAWPGLPISQADCYLLADRPEDAAQFVERLVNALRSVAWSDEVVRVDLVNAEIERRHGHIAKSRSLLDRATQWIVQSGSQEHLCALHLQKGRLAIDEGALDLARTALAEGIHLARECQFGYFGVHLQVELAGVLLRLGDAREALRAATTARYGLQKRTGEPAARPDTPQADLVLLGSDHPACGYVWGTSRAGLMQAEALARLGQPNEAVAVLRAILDVQRRIGDPWMKRSEELVATLVANTNNKGK